MKNEKIIMSRVLEVAIQYKKNTYANDYITIINLVYLSLLGLFSFYVIFSTHINSPHATDYRLLVMRIAIGCLCVYFLQRRFYMFYHFRNQALSFWFFYDLGTFLFVIFNLIQDEMNRHKPQTSDYIMEEN